MAEDYTAPWVDAMTTIVKAAPTIEEGVLKVAQLVHNEIVHGGGMTNPIAVADQFLAAAKDVADALVANTPAGSPSVEPQPEPQDTVAGA